MQGGQGTARFDCELGRVTCLVDGAAEFGTSVFLGAAPETLSAAGPEALETEFNAFLLQQDGQPLTLVDSGCGALFADKGGRLLSILSTLGVTPAQIGRVILTHLHTDHVGGMVQDGQKVFAGAEVLLHQAEHAYWAEQDHAAAAFLRIYADQVRLVQDAEMLEGGLRCWHLPGHTPGHMGVRLGDELVIVGDLLHSEPLQLADPEIAMTFDTDADLARASRRAALQEIAAKGQVYCGGHQLGPQKFGRLLPEGAGYRKVAP